MNDTEIAEFRAAIAAQAAELEELRKRAEVAEHGFERRTALLARWKSAHQHEPRSRLFVDTVRELTVVSAEPQPQSADRATRELWMDEYSAEGAIQSLDDTGLLRETKEGGCGAGPDGQVAPYRITITAERVEGSDET